MSEDSYSYPLPPQQTDSSLGSDPAALAGADPVVYNVIILLTLALVVLMIVSAWKLFKKAGKPGWASIVPFYNTWVLVEIAKLSVVWFILTFIPIVSIVALVVIYNGIAKAFGKGVGTTVLMVFFPYIMFPYLAFSKNVVYQGEAHDNLAATGVTNQPSQNNGFPTNTPPAAS